MTEAMIVDDRIIPNDRGQPPLETPLPSIAQRHYEPRSTNVPFKTGHRIDLLTTGDEYFPALLHAIAAAHSEIHLETYIFADDATGQAVLAALVAAARRGLSVRLLVDGFGSREIIPRLYRELGTAGGEVLVFRPEVARLRLRRQRLRRLHRKLAMIDARLAFVGGINIIDDRQHPTEAPRFDYALRIEGPLLADIARDMRQLWRLVRWAHLGRRPPLHAEPVPQTRSVGMLAARLVVRDNLWHRRDIEEAYLAAIDTAKREILLANAYFLPGLRFRHTLREAAGRGVHVALLLQGRIEYRLLHYATQALYGSLATHGIRIYEYQAGFLHAKAAVIDGEWLTVGSSNIDPFSLLLAREANLVVRDTSLAAQLRRSLLEAMSHQACELPPDELSRRPWPARFLRWLAYALVRLLLGLTRYGGREWRQ